MGDMADELKTPLHSIKADLEVLSLLISKIPKGVLDDAVASLQTSSRRDFSPGFIFRTINASCKIMISSIDSSQDFKVSCNTLPLSKMESFASEEGE